jgi:hypothetical protein
MAINFRIGFAPAPVPAALCASCIYGHIQRGFACGEESFLCSYGFGLRSLMFVVRECSDYEARPEAQAARTGFVKVTKLNRT